MNMYCPEMNYLNAVLWLVALQVIQDWDKND